ncbi:MAG: ATP-binding protein, partial [Planctomycetota bacterium]
APMDLAALLDELEALFAQAARGKGLVFTAEREPALPRWILGDALRLRQVVMNLLGNACKFTMQGSVRLQVGMVEQRLRIAVTDSGIGIAEEQMPQLFAPFAQGDASNTRRFGGSGLGLAISRQMVAAMGGELQVTSQLGMGSTFTVLLPVVAVSEPPAPSPDDSHDRGHALAGRHVLIVEDNPINQQVLSRQLDGFGLRVTVADDGAQALGLLAVQSVDLVLMDMQMPVLDGLATTRELRRRESEAGRLPVPVVGLSASAQPEDRQACMDAGMDAFCTKPVQWSQLHDIFTRLLATQADGGQSTPPS